MTKFLISLLFAVAVFTSCTEDTIMDQPEYSIEVQTRTLTHNNPQYFIYVRESGRIIEPVEYNQFVKADWYAGDEYLGSSHTRFKLPENPTHVVIYVYGEFYKDIQL